MQPHVQPQPALYVRPALRKLWCRSGAWARGREWIHVLFSSLSFISWLSFLGSALSFSAETDYWLRSRRPPIDGQSASRQSHCRFPLQILAPLAGSCGCIVGRAERRAEIPSLFPGPSRSHWTGKMGRRRERGRSAVTVEGNYWHATVLHVLHECHSAPCIWTMAGLSHPDDHLGRPTHSTQTTWASRRALLLTESERRMRREKLRRIRFQVRHSSSCPHVRQLGAFFFRANPD